MQRLEKTDAMIVQQKKEWGEILTGFETANKYTVLDPNGRELYYAAEVGGSFLSRNFLKSLRPFTIQIMDAQGGTVLRLERPWRWVFYELNVYDASGTMIGTVRKRWSWARRLYVVLDAMGNELFELFGPIFKPWTFQIRADGMDVGAIRKKWSGLGKEMFSDADNFGVQWPADLDVSAKAVLLGAVFLIDFVHFEDNQRN